MADIVHFSPFQILQSAPAQGGGSKAEGGALFPSGSALCTHSYLNIMSGRAVSCNRFARFDFDLPLRSKLRKRINLATRAWGGRNT